MISKTAPAFNLKNLFGLALAVLLILNGVSFAKTLTDAHFRRKAKPYPFYGIAFSGLDQVLPAVKTIGYYTDRDLDKTDNAAIFAQAQYMLAPILVDLDYIKYEYILFDASTEEKSMAKIKEIGAIPLKKNQFGIILAKRPL